LKTTRVEVAWVMAARAYDQKVAQLHGALGECSKGYGSHICLLILQEQGSYYKNKA
jgi:hypothetical protein